MSELPLLAKLLGNEKSRVEYAMHVAWPPDEDGNVAEDWMTCESLERLRYRLSYWRGKGVTCTPLVRTVTTPSWERW